MDMYVCVGLEVGACMSRVGSTVLRAQGGQLVGSHLSPRSPPCSIHRRVFPRGLPDEFALVLTLLLKKHTHQSTWYLFQVTDGDGYPQVSPPPPLLLLVMEQYPSSPTTTPACDVWGLPAPSHAQPRGHPISTSTYPILSGCTGL